MSNLAYTDFIYATPSSRSKQFDVMILSNGRQVPVDKSNFYPLTRISENFFVEGYWFSNDSNETKKYPFPKSTFDLVDSKFIDKLQTLMTEQNNTDKRITVESYFGSSVCRICECSNGSREFILTNDGTTFRVPNGVLHYYKDHNVQPSLEFYNFILKF